jgi:site-specific recombinase XerD
MSSPTTFKRKIKVHFYPVLAEPDRDGWCAVRLTARWHGETLRLRTGERVLPEKAPARGGKNAPPVQLWDAKTNRVTDAHPDAIDVNGRLNDWQRDIVAAFNDLWDAAPYTKVTKEALYAHLFPTPESTAPDLTQFTWRQLLEQWKEKNRHLASSSLRKYDQMATEMEKWRPALRPAQLTEDVATDYRNHLLDLELSDAAIKVHFTGIRKCLERLGKPTEAEWLQYAAKNAPQLDLEIDEVHRLLRWRPTSDELAEERDRWLLQMLSGRRYEDFEKLDAKRQLVTLTTEAGAQVPALLHVQGKTGNDAAVPLPPLAVRIGEKWGWRFPARSWQYRCDKIKEVAAAAGLVREWDDRRITGGKVIHHWRPVHQVIGTHTARHTAATLLKQVSGNKLLARLVLGHADEDVTDRYAKDKARLLAPQLLEAWHKVLGEWYDGQPA